MLIHNKIFVQLLLPCLLLSFQLNAKATISELKGFQFKPDFVSPDINDWAQIQTNDQDKRAENIYFQVNSEITYLKIGHFKKPESKQAFLEAIDKQKELHLLIQKTDSLRKTYAASADSQKDKIAASILEGEHKVIILNEEIPALYDKARLAENLYWQSAAAVEKAKFIDRIKFVRDSIQQVTAELNEKQSVGKTFPDTIIYYRADKLNEVAAEPISAVVYKIQVGSFKTKMPDLAAKAIKKLELLRKVDRFKDEKGITVLTTGSLKSYQEALTLQTQVKLEGIKTATISAYKNGKRITLEEAKKLTNEVNIKP
jgi:hypothetical protein